MIHPMNQSPTQTTGRLKPSSNRVVLSNAGSALMSPSVKSKQSLNSPLPASRKTFINDTRSPRSALNQSMNTPLSPNRNGLNQSTNQSINPVEETPLFKTGRAKKLFTQFDTNCDKKLSKIEFDNGLRSLVQSINQSTNHSIDQSIIQSINQSNDQTINPNPSLNDLNISFTQSFTESGDCLIDQLSQSQLDALFKEADYDADQSISLSEFLWRFAGGPIPINQSIKPTLILQTIKPPIKDTTKISVEDVRAVLEAVYDGPKIRYSSVDLTKIEQVSNAALKRICTQTLQAEKDESVAEKRPMEEWASHVFRCSGLTQKHVDRLFAQLDTKRTGRIDLGPFFSTCQLRPSRRNKKKSYISREGYLLTTVPAPLARDWIQDCLFSHLSMNYSTIHSSLCYPYKCHPPLAHWGEADKKKKCLDLKRGETGYKQFLFLSEHTKIRAIIKKHQTINQSQSNVNNQSINQSTSPSGRRTNQQRTTGTQSIKSSTTPQSTLLSPKSSISQSPNHVNAQSINQPINPLNDEIGFHIYVTFRTELTEIKRCEFFYHCRVDLGVNESYQSMIPVLSKSWRDGELDTINHSIKQSINQSNSDESIEWTKYCGTQEEEEYSIPIGGTTKD